MSHVAICRDGGNQVMDVKGGVYFKCLSILNLCRELSYQRLLMEQPDHHSLRSAAGPGNGIVFKDALPCQTD